jgi:hypothetical protein
VKLKVLTKDVGNPEDKSLEAKFNEFAEGEITIHSVQFFQFNKIAPDNSVEKQLMCCGVLYLPKSDT